MNNTEKEIKIDKFAVLALINDCDMYLFVMMILTKSDAVKFIGEKKLLALAIIDIS